MLTQTAQSFTISVKTLKKALSFVGGAIQANPIVPALENVLFEIKEGTLTLTGSDLNTVLTTSVEVADDSLYLRFLAPYKLLSNLLATFPEQPLKISINPDTFAVKVVSTSGVYELAGENPADFPVAETDSESRLTFSFTGPERKAFVERLSKMLFATSTNEMAPHLRGVCWWGNECCTTDSNQKLSRLAGLTHDTGNEQYIIPSHIVTLVSKLSATLADDQAMTVSLGERNILFVAGQQSIMGTLIDAGVSFPDYRLIFPIEFAYEWVISRSELIAALQRVLVLTWLPTDVVILSADSDTGKLTLSVRVVDLSQQGKETLSATINESLEIGFVGRTLLDALQALIGPEVTLNLNGPGKAMKLSGDDENVSVLLFPIKY